MRKLIGIVITSLLLLPALLNATPKAAYVWNQIADGFNYAKYSFEIIEGERATIHAFRIDLNKFRFDMVMAADEISGSTALELAKKNKALLVINGGFFTPEHKSIGLIVRDGKILNQLHKTSWWSIFAIKDGSPVIMKPSDYKSPDGIAMALQAGPRLVVGGKIPTLKENVAIRSAVGISHDGMITIAITSGQGISMNELARRMRDSSFQGGLGCPDAMALDGGSSSQIYVKVGKFEFSQPSLAKITNGLGVFRRNF